MRLAIALGLGVLLLSAPCAFAETRIIPASAAGQGDLPQIQVLSNDDHAFVLTFDLPALAAEEMDALGQRFQSVAIPGGALTGETGQPALPTYTKLVSIPARAGVTVTATVEQQQDLPDYNLLPMQEEEGTNVAYDPAAYARDDFGDAPLASAGAPAICRNLRVVPLTFQPVSFNPARRTLRVASRIRVEVRFDGVDLVNAKEMRQSSVASSYDGLYREEVLNYTGPQQGERVENGTWVVICPDDPQVTSRLQPLLDWRTRKGLPVRLATTTETGTTATAIKAWLQNAYNTWPKPPEFIVLAGDASAPYSIPTFHDPIYSGEGDHPYCQLEGGDILADAHVGRLSFNSLSELETIVAKIVGYESNPDFTDPTWFPRGLVVGDPYHSQISVVQVMQWIKTRLRQIGYTQVDTVFSGDYPTQMRNSLNRGVTVFAYRGYLGMSGWSNTNTAQLTNGWKMPFTCISTCGTGSFEGETSLSEGFIRAGTATSPKGAIASIGTATWNTHTRYNNCFTFGVFQGLLYEGLYDMGADHTRGKLELYRNYIQRDPNAVTEFTYWNNLMGDPATECWTGVPLPMAITHPASLPVGANSVTVTVQEGGNPCPGATVCLSKGLETWVVGQTDSQGVCELPITQATSGTLLLTVTKHDRRPYLYSIPIAPQQVYVAYQASGVDDDNTGTSHGNADGLINPGESIELRVQLRNFGSQSAPGVTAVLTSDDPYVTITDADETFGDIGAGGSQWSGDDFDFTVSPNCPDAHRLDFGLEITSGSNHWHSLVTLPAVSADLNSSGYTLWGAGGNGLLDPGETVDLSIKLINQGGGGATAVVGSLIPLSPYITVVDGSGGWGNIGVGGNAENTTDRFRITADPSTFPGHQAALKVALQFNGNVTDTTEVTIPVGTVTVTDPVGPDRYGYFAFDDGDTAYPDHPTYNWVEIDPAYGGSGTQVVLGDNADQQDKSRTVALPFNFQFYGQPFSTATICSNGWIAMGSTYLTDYRNWSIPGAGAPNNLLAVFWDDLWETTGGHVYQKYDAANHRWIVEWSRMVDAYYGNPTETFEAILYDPAFYPSPSGDGPIVYQYNTVNNVDQVDGYATVGIQNFDHTDGVVYTYYAVYPTAAATLASGRAIRFVPAVANPMGTLQGLVANEYNNAPLPDAEVLLVEADRLFTTGPDGRYAGSAPAGVYTAIGRHTGFEPDTVRGVAIRQGQATNLDFQLRDNSGPEITDVTQIGTTTDTQGPYVINATVTDYSTISSVDLYYRVGHGAWEHLPMTYEAPVYTGAVPGQPTGSQIDYYVRAQDGPGQVSVAPPGAPDAFYTFYITQMFYDYACEDPEDPGWQLGVEGDGAVTGMWIRDDPVGTVYNGEQCQPEDDHTPDPGVKCFVTGNGTVGGAPGDSDVDGGCTTLLSPVFDLSTTTQAYLRYWRWFAMMGNSADDTFRVDVSSDGGTNWVALERLSQNANSWNEVRVDISTLIPLTDQVMFRFLACDLGAAGLIEAAIDDLSIETFTPDVSGVAEGARIRPVFSLDQNRPNPFSARTTIRFSLDHAGPAHLIVYDVQGRVVRRLVQGSRSAGPAAVTWDGRDDRGMPLPSGVYFYQIQSGARQSVRKLMLLN